MNNQEGNKEQRFSLGFVISIEMKTIFLPIQLDALFFYFSKFLKQSKKTVKRFECPSPKILCENLNMHQTLRFYK